MKTCNIFFLKSLLIPISILLAVGCNDGHGTRMQVSGKVLLDGKPLPDAKVTFMPKDGSRPANAVTDENGEYSNAATFSPGDGVLLGEHWIAITPLKPPPMPGVVDPDAKSAKGESYRPPIPLTYGMPKESGLTATVAKGTDNQFTFELDSKFK